MVLHVINASPFQASSGNEVRCLAQADELRESLAFCLVVPRSSSCYSIIQDFIDSFWCQLCSANFYRPKWAWLWIEVQASAVNNRIISIQRLSFHFRYSLYFLWIFFIIIISISSIKWPGREKCLATGFLILRFVMSEQWPVKRMQSAFSVSSTYWMVHHLHSIKYTTFLVPQSAVAFTRNRASFVVLLNTVPGFIWAHALQRGRLQGLLPLYISLWFPNWLIH